VTGSRPDAPALARADGRPTPQTGAAAADGTMRRRRAIPYAAITLIVLLAIWQAATVLFAVPEYLLPAPTAIVADMAANWRLLANASVVTIAEVMAGFVLSVLIGVPLAALLSSSTAIESAIYPIIVGSNTVPKVALAPLLLAWFGFGVAPKIVIVVLVTFFPIVINSVVGFKSLPPQMYYLARSMGASTAEMFWLFRIPNALPSIFAGLKVASVLSVIGAVVAEFVGADSGLGYAMMAATSDLNIARQFSAIMSLSVIGTIFFWLIGCLERALLPWHSSMRSETLGI
jgi:NitT/TauT family transport system permease protein